MRAIFILALLTACQRLPPADSGSPYVSPSETGTEQINTDTGTDNGMPECMGNGEDFCCPINELVGTPFYIEGMEEKAPKETPFQRTCIPEFCHSTSYPMKVNENLGSQTWVYYPQWFYAGKVSDSYGCWLSVDECLEMAETYKDSIDPFDYDTWVSYCESGSGNIIRIDCTIRLERVKEKCGWRD